MLTIMIQKTFLAFRSYLQKWLRPSEESGNGAISPIPWQIDPDESVVWCVTFPHDYLVKKASSFDSSRLIPRQGRTDISTIRACHFDDKKCKSLGKTISSSRSQGSTPPEFKGFFQFSPALVKSAFNSFHIKNNSSSPFEVDVVASPIFDRNSPEKPWPISTPLCQEFGYNPAHADLLYSIPFPPNTDTKTRAAFRLFCQQLAQNAPPIIEDPEPESEEWVGPPLCQQKKSA